MEMRQTQRTTIPRRYDVERGQAAEPPWHEAIEVWFINTFYCNIWGKNSVIKGNFTYRDMEKRF